MSSVRLRLKSGVKSSFAGLGLDPRAERLRLGTDGLGLGLGTTGLRLALPELDYITDESIVC